MRNLSVSSDGSEKERKNDDHSDGLERTRFLHERQIREMLYGAVVAKNLDTEESSVGDGYEVGRASANISWSVSVGSWLTAILALTRSLVILG